MRIQTALIAVVFCLGAPLGAQTSTPGTQQNPVQHQPGTPAPHKPSQPVPDQKPEPTAAAAKADPAKEAAIRHLMELTQSSKLGDNIQSYITSQVRTGVGSAIKPDALSKFMDEFNQKLVSAAPASSVTDAMVPIYASAFSTEDIQGLIQFYESPLGQRVVKNLPAVDQQSQAAGVRIEQGAALAILRAMSQEYPELKQILPPESGQPEPGATQPPAAPQR